MTHTWVEERDLNDMDVPITVKVCVSPGFNNIALQEVGYSDTWDYFLGRSNYNDSLYGWAGHRDTLEAFGSVPDVLEKVRNYAATDIIEDMYAWTAKREHINIPIEELEIARVNYPHNCYSLSMFNLTQHFEVIELFIVFKNLENKTAEILLKDTNVACNREVKDHSFFSTGDSIKLTGDQVSMAYMVEISRNVFVKEDPSKRCTEYPTDTFESYKECDDHFMRQLLEDISPDLLPVWLTDDPDSATTLSIDNGNFSK